jgi:Mrp family chromosome partitioning ATPase
MDLAARLGRLQLLVVTGKGGVGKTAVAASLGRLLATAGRRALVLEVDPRENVHQMLGVSPSGGAIVGAGPRLWVQNLKPGQVLDDIVRERLKVEMLARRVLASPIYEQFSASAPGLKELAILGHALRLLRHSGPPDAPELDVVVLDAPATGHGVRLLAAPRLVSEVIRNGPFAALAGELAGFVADPERCGIVVVTQAEEMPVEEALELREALSSQLARQPELLVINGLFPPLPSDLERPEIFDPMTPLDPESGRELELLTFWRHRRFLNERQLECLARWWEGPRVELPQLALERGPQLTDALQRLLAAGLAAAPAGAGHRTGSPTGAGG